MESILGTTVPVYIGVVVIIMGFCAFMTGQALANGWKPLRELVIYCILLGFASRFLVFALYDGELFSVSGYLVDFVVLTIIGLFAFRVTKARKMVSQYPWLYNRAGLFGWHDKG